MSRVIFKYLGIIDNWFRFRASIGEFEFNYFTGLGHARNEKAVKHFNAEPIPKTPSESDFLECLYSDADAGSMTFSEFCDNFGYSNDSISALNIYRECEETARKIRLLERKNLISRPKKSEGA